MIITMICLHVVVVFFFFSSRRRHTRCALVTGVQTCALPISRLKYKDLTMEASKDISRLIEIMAALRDPDKGCPWDVEQDFATIKPYTIEEEIGRASCRERVCQYV